MIPLRILKTALKLAFRNFGRRRFRTALTLLGVAVGIATIVALVSVAYGAKEQAVSFLSEATDFMITPKAAGELQAELPERLIKQIRLYAEVEAAGPVLSQMVFINKELGWALGVTPDTYEIIYIPLREGEVFEEGEKGKIIVGSNLADQLDLKVGDSVRISASSDEPGKVFVVVGVLQPTGSVVDMGCYMDLKELQEIVHKRGKISMIMVKLRDPRLGESFKEKVEKRYPNLNVVEPEQISENVGKVLDMLNSVLIAIGSISLLIGGLGIMNTTMVSVLERIREIGIMKAIGAKRSHVLVIFLTEAMITSFVGGILGAIGGVLMAKLTSTIIPKIIGFPTPYKVFPALIFGPIALSVVLGIIAGFYPSWKGANVRPIEAIRYE
ncbi:MAG TPA: ABC transporter permease [Candidatus Korarchaeota archaeon]|nr:ABC transporter permease [Candidatus Korarchaeota archaeon]